MNRWIYIFFIMTIVATTASAIYYLSENFEGTWPPTGWSSQSWGDMPQYAYWQQSSDGPWGHYAFGYAEIGQPIILVQIFIHALFQFQPEQPSIIALTIQG